MSHVETGVEHNHRMELQYEGTGLHGWAKQKGLTTVEGCLEKALSTVLGSAPELRVAGRTDAGVHARRQVASLRLPAGIDLLRLRTSLNALTPPEIAVTRITRAPARFDAREDAYSRVYRYYLSTLPVLPPFWSRYCWYLPARVDEGALRSAAAAVVGRHDFTAFTPTETEHVYFRRSVSRCAWKRGATTVFAPAGAARGTAPINGRANLLYLEIEAEAFLRHMVRTLVGTMLEVAQGKRALEDIDRLLRGGSREEAGPTAPACGLFLWDVRYGRAGSGRRDRR